MEPERIEHETTETQAARSRLFLVEGDRRVELDLSRVEWLAGAGRFVWIHAGDGLHRYPLPLGTLGARLDSERFVRIHRSTIVNVESVVALHSTESGAAEVELRDGTRLPLSRNQRRLESELEAREHAVSDPARS